jgi:hypothetical protein
VPRHRLSASASKTKRASGNGRSEIILARPYAHPDFNGILFHYLTNAEYCDVTSEGPLRQSSFKG